MKSDFPIFNRTVNNKPLVFLDSAASSQKPKVVINKIKDFYETHYSNIHRGIYTLSEEATNMYEDARDKVAKFINAKNNEIVFTKSATEGINLVANSFVKPLLKKGDIILLTEMEHHANLVPWQIIAKQTGAKLDFVPFDINGDLDQEKFQKKLKNNPKFVSLVHVSNVLGTINPVKDMIRQAKEVGATILVDGSQSAPHMKIDVKDLNADFFVFSGHKTLGPTGIGVLFGKSNLLDKMNPFLGGGGVIKEVCLDSCTYVKAPMKFEAGTPNIAGAIGLVAAIDYLENIGMNQVEKKVSDIVNYAYEELNKLKFITIYGPKIRAGLISFNLADMHSHDVSSILDEDGIAIRSGHHCCQPLMKRLNISSSCRASFHIYNTKDDVDKLIESLKRAAKIFKVQK